MIEFSTSSALNTHLCFKGCKLLCPIFPCLLLDLLEEFIGQINFSLEHLKKKRYFKKNSTFISLPIFLQTSLPFPVATSHCTLVVHGLSHSHSAKESLERNRDAPGPCLNCAVSATKLQCEIFCFPGQLLPLHKVTAGGSNASV